MPPPKWRRRVFERTVRPLSAWLKDYYWAASKLRNRTPAIFYWKWFSVVGVAIIVLGLSVVFASNYYDFGMLAVALGGIWSLGYWLVSDGLIAQRPSDSCQILGRWVKYRITEWGVFGLILTILFGIELFAYESKLEYQQKDVLNKLELLCAIPPGSKNPNSSVITVRNKSDFDISGKHRIFCVINRENQAPNYNMGIHPFGFVKQASGGWLMMTSTNPPPLPPLADHPPLLGGGDAQSDTCIGAIRSIGGDGPLCVDLTIIFQYEIVKQPGIERRKYARFTTSNDGGGYMWVGQPVKSISNYCDVPNKE